MKRREALKNIGLTAGFVVATPSVFSLLQSCTSEAETWTPLFFTLEEGVILKAIADTILPKTDTPSATEVNVPEFLDRYVKEILSDEDQAETKASMASLVTFDYLQRLLYPWGGHYMQSYTSSTFLEMVCS